VIRGNSHLNPGPRTLKLGKWCPGAEFDALPRDHPVTESSYINSLANRPYRSTVKTLPATLPEPRTTVRGPRPRHIGPWSTDPEPRILCAGLQSQFPVPSSKCIALRCLDHASMAARHGSMIAALGTGGLDLGSWILNGGYLGKLLDVYRFGSRGGV